MSTPRLAERARGRSGGDLVLLLAVAALALAPLAGLLVRVWSKGGVITGADGFLVADPLQYLNWLRQAGDHGAVGNLYDLQPGPRSFVHPLVLLSGLTHRLGLGVAASYLIWKPVAVLALVGGALTWSGRFLERGADRRLAALCGLLFASPIAALTGWTGLGGTTVKFNLDFVSGELWTGTYLWGYLFTAIAVGLMPIALLAYERGRDGGPRAALVLTAALGALVAWLQPWQGATLVLILCGAEAVAWRRGGRPAARIAGDALGPLVAIGLPLAYYFALSHLDDSWRLAGIVNDFGRWPLWVTLAGIAPLAIPAIAGYRLAAPAFADVALRLWPPAALLVFYQPAGTFPFHAFQGLALPLAVLAMLGLRDLLGHRPLPLLAVGLYAALLIVPGTLYRADELRGAVNAGRQPFFLRPGELDALRYIEHTPRAGGVLTPVYSGILVPAYTGRETYIGAGSWTPDFQRRQLATERLFSGTATRPEAERLLRAAGPRFVYADCQGRADISALIAALSTGAPRRFGCARVWELRPALVRSTR